MAWTGEAIAVSKSFKAAHSFAEILGLSSAIRKLTHPRIVGFIKISRPSVAHSHGAIEGQSGFAAVPRDEHRASCTKGFWTTSAGPPTVAVQRQLWPTIRRDCQVIITIVLSTHSQCLRDETQVTTLGVQQDVSQHISSRSEARSYGCRDDDSIGFGSAGGAPAGFDCCSAYAYGFGAYA